MGCVTVREYDFQVDYLPVYIDAKSYNNLLIAPSCIFTLCIAIFDVTS